MKSIFVLKIVCRFATERPALRACGLSSGEIAKQIAATTPYFPHEGAASLSWRVALPKRGSHEKKWKRRRKRERESAQCSHLSWFDSFKGIDRFYDIGGFLKNPDAFALVVEVLAERYRGVEFDSICGLDARGFVLGPPASHARVRVIACGGGEGQERAL